MIAQELDIREACLKDALSAAEQIRDLVHCRRLQLLLQGMMAEKRVLVHRLARCKGRVLILAAVKDGEALLTCLSAPS